MKRFILVIATSFLLTPCHAETVLVDADGFASGTDISSSFSEVTLSSGGEYPGLDGKVYAHTSGLASTGSGVFANNLSFKGQWYAAEENGFSFRADFQRSAKIVSLDFISNSLNDRGILSAYDSYGALLESVETPDLTYGEIYTATITRQSYEIAYIIAGGSPTTQDTIYLDNLTADLELFRDAKLEAAVKATLGIPEDNDISPEDMLRLTSLSVRSKGISDLTGLEYAVNLEYLDARYNQIEDLAPLAALTKLTTCYLLRNAITDLSPIADLPHLETLSCGENPIQDISPVGRMTNLTNLGLTNLNISDVSSISTLTELLQLNLSSNNISDISPLTGLLNLQILMLTTNNIQEISSCANLINLQTLWLGNNKITDISALSNLSNLAWLYINRNQISDLSSLTGLAKLWNLNLADNQINDISALGTLMNLKSVNLANNQVADLYPLTQLMRLTSVDFLGNPLNQAAFETDLPQIQYNNPHVSIDYDAEQSFQLTVNTLGGGSVDPNNGSYKRSTVVNLTATPPDVTYVFKGWTGTDDDFSYDLSNTVLIDSDKTVTAEFMPAIIVSKPSEGEVWASGSSHTIKWSSCGVGTVDIAYSSNAGQTWNSIGYSADDNGSYLWQLPDIVDSNQCRISIVPGEPDPSNESVLSGVFTIHPDFVHLPTAANWKTLGGNFKRTGLSNYNGPEIGCVKWQFETDKAIPSSITIGPKNRVYIACENGKLYVLDSETGLPIWSYDTGVPLINTATIGPDGTAFVGGIDNTLYAIDLNGNLRWTHVTDGFIYSSVAVSPDGTIYACSQDGSLYALGWDGSELWEFKASIPGPGGTGSILASPAIAQDGTIYIGALYDPNLYALNPHDGSIKWSCKFEFQTDPSDPNSEIKSAWPFASPVIAPDGTIYQTLLYDTCLYAIEPENGNVKWSKELADPCMPWFGPDYPAKYPNPDGWSEPALGPDGTIYVSLDDPYLRAVNADGSIKWIKRFGVAGGFTLTIGSDNLIYAASDDGNLYVINPEGKETAILRTNKWLGFPVITTDNTLIVGDTQDRSLLVTDERNTILMLGLDNCDGQMLVLHHPQDLDGNLSVNYLDLAGIAADWLNCTDISMEPPYESLCGHNVQELYLLGDINTDMYVDFYDFTILAKHWLH